MRRAVIVVALAILSAIGLPPLGAAGTPPLGAAGATWGAVVGRGHAALDDLPPMMARDICDTARQFVEDAQPQQALRFIDGVRYTQAWPCLDVVEQEAEAAVAAAQEKAEEAKDLASPNPAKAKQTAQDALTIDADNQLAGELLADLTPPTPVQRAHMAWEEFFKGTLTPLGDLALPVGGVLLGVLVLARVVALLRIPWPPSSRGRRRGAAFFAVLFALAGGIWVAAGLSPLPSGSLGVPASRVLTLLLVLAPAVAVPLAAYALATRLRVSVEVRGEDGTVDEAGTGHVVALLAELGGEDPRGAEVARGTDVSVLDDTAISGLSKYPVVGLLTTALQVVLGITPWRVRVDVESPDRHSVSVSRNGRTVAAGVVDRDPLGLRTPRAPTEGDAAAAGGGVDAGDATHPKESQGLPDLHPFAAAMALVAMAPEYIDTDFVGLYGVRDWRSLALTDIATRFYDEIRDKDSRVKLLNDALKLDQANLPAAMALHHARHRHATSDEDLERYCTTLQEILGRLERDFRDRDDADPMRARVMLTYLVVSANLAAAMERKKEAPDSSVPAVVSGNLVDLLRRMESKRRDPHRVFAEDMAPNAASLFLAFHPSLDPHATAAMAAVPGAQVEAHTDNADADRLKWALGQIADTSRFSPRAVYNLACLEVHRGRADDAVPLFAAAFDDPTYRAWATKDPALDGLQDNKKFQKLVAPTQQELLDLSPVKEHAAALRRAGLGTSEALARSSARQLARHLKVDLLVARHVREVAGLWLAIPASVPLRRRFGEEYLSSLQGQVFTALVDRGIGSCRALRRHGNDQLAEKVATAVQEACGPNVTVQAPAAT